ncbi:cyclase [Epidermidibacterium keratini]|uniref:Cyclase n=1 Tax=Epidermidibacterium keratini TaxID=1891644 RepID=A0A7L4YIB6_9ACTN|nr:SRPBCC family protein [Epidermidibacterium keratini]QHB99184.1 cyclase [Epidermidibacterium keratini]
MADQSTQSIVINANPEAIMDVIGDFEAYPQWAGSIKKGEPLDDDGNGWATKVAFDLDAGPISDSYTLAYDWDDYPNRVSWQLVEGKMQKSQQGSYVLSDRGDGTTEVTYNLSVELAIPMIGMMKRKAEKVIMDTALKELKKRVESLAS